MTHLPQILVVLIFLGVPASVEAANARETPISIPPTYDLVNDYHGVLTIPQQIALKDKLYRLEERNGTQIVLLIVETTAPETTHEYTQRVMEAWDLGHNGESTGVLFVVNASDASFWIGTGGAIQGALPDVMIRRIIAEKIEPHWRRQQWSEGIEAGIDAMISATTSELTRPPVWEMHTRLTPRAWALLGLVIFGLSYSGYYLRKWYRTRKNREVKS